MSVADRTLSVLRITPAVSGHGAMFRKRTIKRFSTAAVFLLAAGSTFSLILLREPPSASQSVAESVLQARASSAELGLRVNSENDRLLLSWNALNPFVMSATGGILLIEDGSQRREVHLDTNQIADGVVSYKPTTNDVTFRLTVNGRGGSGVTGTRVLEGAITAAFRPAIILRPSGIR